MICSKHISDQQIIELKTKREKTENAIQTDVYVKGRRKRFVICVTLFNLNNDLPNAMQLSMRRLYVISES